MTKCHPHQKKAETRRVINVEHITSEQEEMMK